MGSLTCQPRMTLRPGPDQPHPCPFQTKEAVWAPALSKGCFIFPSSYWKVPLFENQLGYVAKAWKVSCITQLLSLCKVRGQLLLAGEGGHPQKTDAVAMGVSGCNRVCGVQDSSGNPWRSVWGQTPWRRPGTDRGISKGIEENHSFSESLKVTPGEEEANQKINQNVSSKRNQRPTLFINKEIRTLRATGAYPWPP